MQINCDRNTSDRRSPVCNPPQSNSNKGLKQNRRWNYLIDLNEISNPLLLIQHLGV